jgi:hypothetical protein
MAILTVLLFLLVPSDGSAPTITDQIESADGDCYTDTSVGDPVPTYCLVSEKPPDISVINDHGEQHEVFVEVIENGTTRYAETVSLSGADSGQRRQILEDVTRSSGNYTIRATLDGGRRASLVWRLEEGYLGEGGPTWVVRIGADESLAVRHIKES